MVIVLTILQVPTWLHSNLEMNPMSATKLIVYIGQTDRFYVLTKFTLFPSNIANIS